MDVVKNKKETYYFSIESAECEKIKNQIKVKKYIEILKDDKRSLVYVFQIADKKYVYKEPREKNRRKWIRFLTLFRDSEVLKGYKNLEKTIKAGFVTNKPVLAFEQRKSGMVNYSYIVYTYLEGVQAEKADYKKVVETLKEIHAKKYLHGDSQIQNFIVKDEKVCIIDADLNRNKLGKLGRAYEYVYLKNSAEGIEEFFEEIRDSFSYKIAKSLNDILQNWRRFKKKIRGKK